jgi:anti-anti-sigma regulatory factor
MTQDVPVVVTRRFDGRLLLSETREARLLTQLDYDAMDPYAVTATFLLDDDNKVKWVFARDLLSDGLHRKTGEGDVMVRPKTGGTATEIELILSVPTGHAQVTLPAQTVAAFIEESHDLVPLGAESQYLHLDATIERLLSRDGDPESPRDVSTPLVAVTTSGSSVQIQICGEIDLSNHTQLKSALSGVELDEAQTVRLDLHRLTFCGIDGCRQLVRFERDARRSGRQISIHGATPMVRKLLGLIAGADLPRFP